MIPLVASADWIDKYFVRTVFVRPDTPGEIVVDRPSDLPGTIERLGVKLPALTVLVARGSNIALLAGCIDLSEQTLSWNEVVQHYARMCLLTKADLAVGLIARSEAYRATARAIAEASAWRAVRPGLACSWLPELEVALVDK